MAKGFSNFAKIAIFLPNLGTLVGTANGKNVKFDH